MPVHAVFLLMRLLSGFARDQYPQETHAWMTKISSKYLQLSADYAERPLSHNLDS
jgi:hypothetical protein